jgi:hypothetical protein
MIVAVSTLYRRPISRDERKKVSLDSSMIWRSSRWRLELSSAWVSKKRAPSGEWRVEAAPSPLPSSTTNALSSSREPVLRFVLCFAEELGFFFSIVRFL